MTILIGLLLWTCGLILNVINKKHRALFEIYLNMVDMCLKKEAMGGKKNDAC